MRRVLPAVLALGVVVPMVVAEEKAVMTVGEVLALARPEADHRITYGPEAQQFGELRLPDGAGPHPVAIVIHGGCWLAEYDLGYMSMLAAALTEVGVATWSLEYRRVGDDGGGWPGTFRDVGAGADHLREIAVDHRLDLEHVVAVGHSAGGHLALWLAGRRGLPDDDPFRGLEPLAFTGVVSLAGIPDLAGYASSEGCGAVVPGLLGGPPEDHPDRLRRTSPLAMVPLGVPQVLVVGELDPIVPGTQADGYRRAARAAGDRVAPRPVDGVGHFELVDPTSVAWPVVRTAILDMLGSAGETAPGR